MKRKLTLTVAVISTCGVVAATQIPDVLGFVMTDERPASKSSDVNFVSQTMPNVGSAAQETSQQPNTSTSAEESSPNGTQVYVKNDGNTNTEVTVNGMTQIVPPSEDATITDTSDGTSANINIQQNTSSSSDDSARVRTRVRIRSNSDIHTEIKN